VPLVGGEWAEVKTLAVGRVQPGTERDGSEGPQTTDLSYFSRLLDAEAFTRLAYGELYRRGTERAGTVCAVMDGAEWLQHFVDRHRPDAVRILDFPHAAEHLGLAAQAVFGAGTAETSEWLGRQLHELRHGDPDAVLAALRALALEGLASPAAAAKVRAEVLGYLEKRRAQLDYAQFDAAGYPVGSGAVESANKLLMEARLKGSGMHWARANVNPMLTLRCALCSGRWAEAWPLIWQGLRRAQAERRREQRQRRHPPPPPAPMPAAPPPSHQRCAARPRPSKGLVVKGRPTADHPWKRQPLSRRAAEFAGSAKH